MEKEFVTAAHLEAFLDKLKTYSFEHSLVKDDSGQGDNKNAPKDPLKSAGPVINAQAENRLLCSRPELLSPLVLAYIGDAVYEIYIRTKVFCNGNFPVGRLHRSSTGFVRAKSQAEAVRKMMDNLSQDEKDIVRRGRNSKPGYMRKNADMIDYKYATGFEALIGYLYLKGENERLFYVLEMSFS